MTSLMHTCFILQYVYHNPLHVLSQPVDRMATYWEDDTRRCINTIQPHDDEHNNARNM